MILCRQTGQKSDSLCPLVKRCGCIHHLESSQCPVVICVLDTKPDHSKTGGKKGLKIIQDPNYHRYGSTLDMDSALETFRPHRFGPKLTATAVTVQSFWFSGCLYLPCASHGIHTSVDFKC